MNPGSISDFITHRSVLFHFSYFLVPLVRSLFLVPSQFSNILPRKRKYPTQNHGKAEIIPRLLFCSLFKFPCIYQQIVCTQYTRPRKQNKTKLTRKRPRIIQINPFHHAVPLNSSVCFQPGFFTNKITVSHFSFFFYLAH